MIGIIIAHSNLEYSIGIDGKFLTRKQSNEN